MPIGNQCQKKYAKIVTAQTGKGAELVKAVDARTGLTISKIMTIGNKTGHIYLFENVDKGLGFDLDYKGRVKVVATQGRAKRC